MHVFALPSVSLWDKSSRRQVQTPGAKSGVSLAIQPNLTFGQDTYVHRKKPHLNKAANTEAKAFDISGHQADEIYDPHTGNTWLHQAVLLQDEAAVAHFAHQNDANLSITNDDGITAFTLCALTGNAQIAKLLRSNGAKLQSWRKAGKVIYPSDLALEKQKSLDQKDPRYKEFQQVIEFFQQEEKPSRKFARLLSDLSTS